MILGALALAGLVLGAPAADVLRDAPCKGCWLATGHRPEEPQPLVVVLHGDEGSPRKVAPLWQPLAERGLCKTAEGSPHLCGPREPEGVERRSLRVLAPQCPASEGCAGSWWRWEGDVAWLLGQIDQVNERARVDPARVYLAGWSGGATYIGVRSPAWFPRFAALSLVGGGAPPRSSECYAPAGGGCASVHFMMGDKNPFYSYASSLHRAWDRCGHTVDFQLLSGKDHGGEWRAYGQRVSEIAWWLLDHKEGCAAKETSQVRAASPATTPEPPLAGPSARASPVEPQGPKPLPPRGGGCSCRTAGEAASPARWDNSAGGDRPTNGHMGGFFALFLGVLRSRRLPNKGFWPW